jgi:hypothetical protein
LDERARLFQKLGYYTGRLRVVRRLSREERWRWFRKQLKGRLPRAEDPVDRVLDQQSEDMLRAADLDARPGQDVLRFQSRAARAYLPGRYRGTVDLVVAAKGPVDEARLARIRANRRGWDKVAAKVEVSVIPSSHVGLITDQVALLAEAIRSCFNSKRQR